ncbi:MAG: hypothetical protein MJ230_07935 [bacterium]|nr:hypothetical protein [bacterium]
MPVIIIAIIGLWYFLHWLYENSGKNTKPYNKDETDKIMIDCVGKSEQEQKKIINDYQKRK